MGFEQYHEPPEELSQETRSFARMMASLREEADAIGWYEQRISVEQDEEAKKIMKNAQTEEMKHFSMDLAYLLRLKPTWKKMASTVINGEGDIVKLGKQAEEKAGI